MNIRLKRRLNALFICRMVIIMAFLVACDQPMQPGEGVNGGRTETVGIPSITLIPSIEAGESMYPGQIVSMRTETPGARIFYTTDGSPPISSSRRYSAFRLGMLGVGQKTIKAIATKPGLTSSDIESFDVDVPLPSVTFSHGGEELPPGSSTEVSTIDRLTIGTNFPETVIRYTAGPPGRVGPSSNTGERYNDENKPSFGDLVSGQTGEYPREITIKAIATSAGLISETVIQTFSVSDRLVTAEPTFSPASGKVASTGTLTIGSTSDGASIYYTTGETAPSTAQTNPAPQITPLEVDFSDIGTGPYPRTVTIRAIAVKSDFAVPNSELAETTFTIQTPAAQPTFSPETGDVANADILTISSATEDATIHYTTDGSTPTAASPLSGTTPLEVNFSAIGTGEKTIKAIAVHADHANSAEASTTFNVAQAVAVSAAARPTFSPASGRVATTDRLTIETDTDGATIRYTTNGRTPTDLGLGGSTYNPRNKPRFSSLGTGVYPRSVTITAIAVHADHASSAEASTTFTVQTPAAKPTFSPASGDVATTDTLTIDSDTDGATIYYTIDGPPPTAESPLSGTTPLEVDFNIGTGEKTIRAIAVHADHANSALAEATFTVKTLAEPPTFISEGGVESGIVPNTGRLTIETDTDGATIRYTTNGRTPTDSGLGGSTYDPRNKPLFSSLGTGNYPRSVTITAIAVKENYINSAEASTTFTVQESAAQPTILPDSSNVETIDSLTISTTTSDAIIRYTTNGRTPTDSGLGGSTYNPRNKPLFSSLRAGAGRVTITAITVKENYINSAEAEKTFTVSLPVAATPTFSPEGGTGSPIVSSTSTLTITSTIESTIYYTTDGSPPTAASPLNGPSPLPVSFGSTGIGARGLSYTIRALAVKEGYTNSAEASTTFTVRTPVATPTFSSEGGAESGIVPDTGSLTIESETEDATIYYTTDGSTPSTSTTTLGDSPLRVSFGSLKIGEQPGIGGVGDYTIKAIAVKAGNANSAEASTTFMVRTRAATPTFSPAGTDILANNAAFTIDGPDDLAIHYTTDGSTPTADSTEYSDAVAFAPLVSSLTGNPRRITIKAIVIGGDNYANSVVATKEFRVTAPAAAAPTFGPAGTGILANDAAFTIDGPDGLTIRYTTDGSTPTADSTEYSDAVAFAPLVSPLTGTPRRITIKAIVIGGDDYANSAVAMKEFRVRPRVVTPTFSADPANGNIADLSISTTVPGATIYYTTDGTTPTTDSTNPSPSGRAGTSRANVLFSRDSLPGNFTIKAIAVKDHYADSAESRETFRVVGGERVGRIGVSIASNSPFPFTYIYGPSLYGSPEYVTINTVTEGATIRYTIDGSAPDPSTPSGLGTRSVTIGAGSLGSGPLPWTVTIRAIAVHPDYLNSHPYSHTLEVR